MAEITASKGGLMGRRTLKPKMASMTRSVEERAEGKSSMNVIERFLSWVTRREKSSAEVCFG
jgi:hypothetical protein